MMLTITALLNEKSNTGMMKVRAQQNFVRNVAIVDIQISLGVCLFSDSSDMCIPNASEKASAIAMVNMPPKTTILECVPEFKPTIKPKVVMIPEVNPKLKPTSNE